MVDAGRLGCRLRVDEKVLMGVGEMAGWCLLSGEESTRQVKRKPGGGGEGARGSVARLVRGTSMRKNLSCVGNRSWKQSTAEGEGSWVGVREKTGRTEWARASYEAMAEGRSARAPGGRWSLL